MYKLPVCLVALILAACGAAGGTAAPRATAGSEVVAIWSRSGGIAGRSDTLTIYADGRLVLEGDDGSRTVQGDAAAVRALRELVAGSEWQALQQSYGKQFPDAFAYTIEAGGKTVRTFDGAKIPPVLGQVMQQIDRLYSVASPTGGA